MSEETRGEFSLADVFEALDAQRRARGLSWAQVASELSGRASIGTRISPSTVSGLKARSSAEADGVLQMLRWLDRTPESFVPGRQESGTRAELLPSAGPDRILRCDTRELFAALDVRRRERQLTWSQVAAEIGGMSVSSLTGLSKGARTAFPQLMRITRWLGLPVAHFVRALER